MKTAADRCHLPSVCLLGEHLVLQSSILFTTSSVIVVHGLHGLHLFFGFVVTNSDCGVVDWLRSSHTSLWICDTNLAPELLLLLWAIQ